MVSARFSYAVPAGKKAMLRVRQWFQLGAGETGTIALAPSGDIETTLATFTSTDNPGSTATLTPFEVEIPGTVLDQARLVFRVTRNAATASRGWFIDDLEIVVKPQ